MSWATSAMTSTPVRSSAVIDFAAGVQGRYSTAVYSDDDVSGIGVYGYFILSTEDNPQISEVAYYDVQKDLDVQRRASCPLVQDGFEWVLTFMGEDGLMSYAVRFDRFKREDSDLQDQLDWDAQGIWYCCRVMDIESAVEVYIDALLYVEEEYVTEFDNYIGIEMSYDSTPALTQMGDKEEKMIILKKSKSMLPGHSTVPTKVAPSQNTATKKWFWASIHDAEAETFFQWWKLELDDRNSHIVFETDDVMFDVDLIVYDINKKYMLQINNKSEFNSNESPIFICMISISQQTEFENFVSSVYDKHNQITKTEQVVLLRQWLTVPNYITQMSLICKRYDITPKIIAIPLVYLRDDGTGLTDLIDVLEDKNELRVGKGNLDLPALGSSSSGYSHDTNNIHGDNTQMRERYTHMSVQYKFYNICTLPKYYSAPDDMWLKQQLDFFGGLNVEDFINIWTYNFHGDRMVNYWLSGEEPEVLQMRQKDRHFIHEKKLTRSSGMRYLLFEAQIRKKMGYSRSIDDLHTEIQKWTVQNWSPIIEDWVEDMLKIFARVPRTTRPMTLFRGESYQYRNDMSMHVEQDQVHTFKSFSLCPTIATNFAKEGGSVNITTFPAGYPLLLTAGFCFPSNLSECECLCPPDLEIETTVEVTQNIANYLNLPRPTMRRNFYQVRVKSKKNKIQSAQHLQNLIIADRRMYNFPISHR